MSQDLSPQTSPETDSTELEAAALSDDPTQVIIEVVLDCYECSSCGYTYNPKKGDSRGKVPEGTAFPDLEARWKCPERRSLLGLCRVSRLFSGCTCSHKMSIRSSLKPLR